MTLNSYIISGSYMNNRKQSIDGFVPRRGGSELGEQHAPSALNSAPQRREIHASSDLQKAQLGQARVGKTLGNSQAQLAARGRSDIDDSLRELDDEPPRKKLSRRERKRQKNAARTPGQRRRRLLTKFIIFAVIITILVGGGILAFKLFRASDGVLNGSIFDLVQNQPLKEDANGRSNFLILGTSEDDPGHQGSNLTDSMMVLSVDQKNKNAYMISIPRDLYVSYGMACNQGYKGKINEYFSCSNTGTDDAAEQDRMQKTQAFVGEIVGLDIQYGVHVNYTVMRDVINAIGGSITVNIEGNGDTPAGIPAGSVMDSNFDWKCGPNIAKRKQTCPPRGHFIDYGPGPQTLDAEHALYLAQARGDAAPTWGLTASNPDRERNQQKILVAIREKALSAGTLTNIGALTGLIDALGNNLRTNIATKEVRTLMDLAQHIPSDAIRSIDISAIKDPVMTNGKVNGLSYVVPVAGVENYTELQAFIKKQISSNPVEREGAVVSVFNASGVAGAAQTAADSLEEKGMTIGKIGNAPEGTYKGMTVYQINKDMTATAAKLQEIYGVTVKTTAPPVSVTGNTDFVVIIGEGAATTKSTSSSTN